MWCYIHILASVDVCLVMLCNKDKIHLHQKNHLSNKNKNLNYKIIILLRKVHSTSPVTVQMPHTAPRREWDCHLVTRFNLKLLLLTPPGWISHDNLTTQKITRELMQNFTAHFWAGSGSGWLSHRVRQPALSRSHPHRWPHQWKRKRRPTANN